MEAGRLTARKMLGSEAKEEWEEKRTASSLYPLADPEQEALQRFLKILEENSDEDPKLRRVEAILSKGVAGEGGWLNRGCIVFSQYCDSVFLLAGHMSKQSTIPPAG